MPRCGPSTPPRGSRPPVGVRGVGAQVALARQESPHRGQVLVGFAKDLAVDLPHTAAALREGTLSEFRAMLIARESGCLDREQRALLDEALCAPGPDGARFVEGLGTGRVVGEVRRRVAGIDPAAVVARNRRAETERRVSLRPAPDTMAYLTGLLPMVQAIAAHVALGREADRLRAEGDPRSRGQLMADLMITRLTGQATATGVPVTVEVVLSDQSLLGAGHEPATIPGWGPVPAQIAREAIARATEDLGAWIRRLYTDPAGNLVALSTKQRLATNGLATYLNLRDQGLCRTPWCDAPARHTDHVIPADQGGPTTAANLQGLCEACNHTKQAPGWTQDLVIDDLQARHTVQTTTPTGHRHRSRAPHPTHTSTSTSTSTDTPTPPRHRVAPPRTPRPRRLSAHAVVPAVAGSRVSCRGRCDEQRPSVSAGGEPLSPTWPEHVRLRRGAVRSRLSGSATARPAADARASRP